MKRRLRRILLFYSLTLLTPLAFNACSTVASRVQKHPEAYNRLSAHDQSLVWHGQIREGMGKDPVYLAWGKPDAVKVASYMGTPHETWTYLAYYSYGDFGYGYGPYGANPWYFRGDWGYYPWYGINYPSWGYPYKAATFVNGKVVAWSTTYW
jgi:hypothetical protein